MFEASSLKPRKCEYKQGQGVCVLPAGHPAETHTAADAGAGAVYDVARCFPAVSGGAAPRE